MSKVRHDSLEARMTGRKVSRSRKDDLLMFARPASSKAVLCFIQVKTFSAQRRLACKLFREKKFVIRVVGFSRSIEYIPRDKSIPVENYQNQSNRASYIFVSMNRREPKKKGELKKKNDLH
eukprot:750851-Hanusia_phi.AAC.3